MDAEQSWTVKTLKQLLTLGISGKNLSDNQSTKMQPFVLMVLANYPYRFAAPEAHATDACLPITDPSPNQHWNPLLACCLPFPVSWCCDFLDLQLLPTARD
jgi:hypothetical protein